MNKLEISPQFSRWPNRIAKLLACIVFPLIWVGGLVTTSDAGMAVPDWPNTYNYNMFAYPIRDWFLGPWDLFVEHGHRLLGSLSGIVAIGLCVATFLCDRRPAVRQWSVLILALVIGQGILGGQRVLQDARILALIHGSVGPAFFATVVAMIAFTSTWWTRQMGSVADSRFWSTDAQVIGSAGLVLASYGQLILGACLRHIPDDSPPAAYAMLIVAHVATAFVVLFLALSVFRVGLVPNWNRGGVRYSAALLVIFIGAQIGLGATTYVLKFGFPEWFGGNRFAAQYIISEKSFWQMNLITLHVAMGSLILATATYHFVRVCRAVSNARTKYSNA